MERFTAKGSWKTEDMRLPDGKGNGTPLQHSCLENPMDGGAWWVAVHGVATSRTRLSDFTLTFHFRALEEEMATHSSILAWRIPGMGETGGLPSMGSHRVRHDWSDLAAAAVPEQKSADLTRLLLLLSIRLHLSAHVLFLLYLNGLSILKRLLNSYLLKSNHPRLQAVLLSILHSLVKDWTKTHN